MALLSTEDSNDSQKRMRAVLTIHPTPVSPCLAQRGSDMRGSTVMTKKNKEKIIIQQLNGHCNQSKLPSFSESKV